MPLLNFVLSDIPEKQASVILNAIYKNYEKTGPKIRWIWQSSRVTVTPKEVRSFLGPEKVWRWDDE